MITCFRTKDSCPQKFVLTYKLQVLYALNKNRVVVLKLKIDSRNTFIVDVQRPHRMCKNNNTCVIVIFLTDPVTAMCRLAIH